MAGDTTSSGDVTDATNHVTQLIRGSLTTELTVAERQSLARSRKVAFGALAACSVLAIVGAIYFWYLWCLTAKTCVDTYIRKTSESSIIHPELAVSWQDKLIGLDISSFSALTLALLFTRLAYGGTRNTLRFFQRDGWSYFGRAYHSVLFTEGFETLCVRFGLLGTLLSFLLAAVAQMSASSVDPTRAPGATVAQVTGSIAQGAQDSQAAVKEIAKADEALSATGELSEDIFLLLCASLVSTFVGTGVAYTVTPSLNWLNERAIGLHQMGHADPGFAAEEFFRQVDRTSQRLAEFDTTTAKMSAAAQHIASFEVSVGTAAKRLGELVVGLERAVKTFEISTQTGKQLAKKLDHLEAMSDRVSELLDRLPERLNDPLTNMSLTAGRFREAALSGEAAFRELKGMAGSARESLSETTQRTNTTWQMLREVQESLRELANSETTQTNEVSKLVLAFDTIGDSLGGLVRKLDALGTHLRQHQAADHEAARLLVDQRSRVLETTDDSTRDDGHSRARGGRAPRADDPRQPRSWWRRIFG